MTHDNPPLGEIPLAETHPDVRPGAVDVRTSSATARLSTVLLLGGLGAALLLSGRMLHTQNVNWDEFLRLGDVHTLLRGEGLPFLQGVYAHAFRWVRYVEGHEIEQILAARYAIYGLHLLTLALLYLVARRFASSQASLAAILVFLGTSYIAEHGTAFRYDPLLTCFLVAALLLTTRAPVRTPAALATGALLAAAAAITVKAILFAPVFVALLCIDVRNRGETRWRGAATWGATVALAFLASLSVAYLLHSLSTPGSTPGTQIPRLSRDAGLFFPTEGLVPRWDYLRRFATENPLAVLLLLVGATALLHKSFRRPGPLRIDALVVLALGLPLASLLVYRNAFPYFYVPLLAFALVWIAIGLDTIADHLSRRWPRPAVLYQLVLAALLAALPTLARLPHLHDEQEHQRALVETVHALFPSPVPYLGRTDTIASFPRQGFFMSTLGMIKYHQGGYEDLRAVLERTPASFVVADHPGLLRALTGHPAELHPLFQLKPGDARYLQQNYVHRWGLLFVPGKRLSLTPGEPIEFEILVPGTYSVEAEHPVTLDGAQRHPRDTAHLDAGTHRVVSESPTTLVLRRRARGDRPLPPTPRAPLFTGF